VADISAVAYDALKTAVEHALGKIREGKRLSTEDVFLLYLGTIAGELREVRGELKEVRAEIARLDRRIDETNRRIDEIAKRIDAVQTALLETNKRIDAVQTTLLEIQKLLLELVKKGG
jgi:chromosome segregation ATPase